MRSADSDSDRDVNGGISDRTFRRGRRREALRRALVAMVVAGAAVACGPVADNTHATAPTSTAVAAAPTTAAAPPAPSATSAPPTTAAPSPSTTPAATPVAKTPTAAPTTRHTTKATPRPTTNPPKTTKPAPAACEIVSNAGNCYNAGQFCRKADIGSSTHAGNGRMIYCRQDGSRGRWGY